MKKYYFTFATDAWTKDMSVFLGDIWVEVVAPGYGQARVQFIELFTTPFMNRPTEFAFQYDEESFEPKYQKGGCLARIIDGEFKLVNNSERVLDSIDLDE